MGQKCGEEYAHLNISQSKGVFPFQRLCETQKQKRHHRDKWHFKYYISLSVVGKHLYCWLFFSCSTRICLNIKRGSRKVGWEDCKQQSTALCLPSLPVIVNIAKKYVNNINNSNNHDHDIHIEYIYNIFIIYYLKIFVGGEG